VRPNKVWQSSAPWTLHTTFFHPIGPFPVQENMRMGKVIVLLQLSLDKGKKHDKTFSILNPA
jgi:hypothetical protein